MQEEVERFYIILEVIRNIKIKGGTLVLIIGNTIKSKGVINNKH